MKEHITDGTPCWCGPEVTYEHPTDGTKVIVHKDQQVIDQYEVGTLDDANKFEIRRMAQEAGLDHYLTVRDFPKQLERFASLVAAHEREKQAEQEPIFSSKCPKCSHKVISTHSADLWWCNKCLHEWPFNKQSEKQSVSQEVKELRQQVAALKAVLDAWNNVEQEPIYISESCAERGCACHYSVEVDGEPVAVYSAPVRTKDLTDEEIFQFQKEIQYADVDPINFARAVIAKDREKNRG